MILATLRFGNGRDTITLVATFSSEAAAKAAVLEYANESVMCEDNPIKNWEDLENYDFDANLKPFKTGQFYNISEE